MSLIGDMSCFDIADAVVALWLVSSGRLCFGLGCCCVGLCRVVRLGCRLRSVVPWGCSSLRIVGNVVSDRALED